MKVLVMPFTLIILLSVSPAYGSDCRSCDAHRAGGTVTYGSGYYPGRTYPNDYWQHYRGRLSTGYGSYPYGGYGRPGSITHTCGAGGVSGDRNLSGGGCVTRYRGPASDIHHLPQIHRQIRRTQPSRMTIQRK